MKRLLHVTGRLSAEGIRRDVHVMEMNAMRRSARWGTVDLQRWKKFVGQKKVSEMISAPLHLIPLLHKKLWRER